MKRALLISLAVLAAVVVVFLAVFGLHRGRTHLIRNRVMRVVPGSIAKLQPMQIGGVQQWVLIRGYNRNAPVVLFLHGGPGAATMYLAHRFQKPLEREFVMVQWDQRGAGKSYSAREPVDSLTLRRELNDTYELTRWLRSTFHQDKIYLVGHSWGSTVGMLAVKEHPEYYRAFIGVGQMAADSLKEREVQREWLLKAAFKANDRELVDRMEAFGDISERDIFRHRGQLHTHKSFLPLLAASFRAPEYTWPDIFHIMAGNAFVRSHMVNDVTHGSLQSTVTKVDVPVFFFLGAYDYLTPSQLAIDYFRRLDAPYKRVYWFPNSAHYPFFEERERFAAAMHEVRVQVDGLQ